MIVYSLFDGIGGGLLALLENGHRNFTYYRSEIDKQANLVFHSYFDEGKLNQYGVKVIDLGDVTKINQFEKADLLLGGSPCTSVSICGLQKGFAGASGLFFEYLRIKKAIYPEYFLLENTPMKKEFLDVFDKEMECTGVKIDSAYFSAQQRKRMYWTNIHINPLPEMNQLTTEDILEPEVDDKYFINPRRAVIICDNECLKHKIAYIGKDSIGNRIYNIHRKAVTLIANGGGLGARTGLYAIPCLTPDRENKRQNGRRFKPPFSKFYTLTTIDSHGIIIGNYIRKLTPIECERLQGLPDNMTKAAGSDSARYKLCGNGWQNDTIKFILKNLRKE